MLIDICGQTFGELQVVCISDKVVSGGERSWVCECSCGRIEHIRGWDLRSGKRTCCRVCKVRNPQRPREKKEISVGPHEAKTDCRAYVDGRCVALVEMFCRTKGECKFYKSKENAE